MWFGLHFPDPDDGAGKLVVLAYEPEHVYRVRAAPDELAVILSLLRDAAIDRGRAEHPCCGSCGERLEVPSDAVLEDECASA